MFGKKKQHNNTHYNSIKVLVPHEIGLIQFDGLAMERDALNIQKETRTQNKTHNSRAAHNKTVDGWGNDLFLDL